MSFADAVRSALTRYAQFSGRARRSEYWYFGLAVFLASVVAAVLDQLIGAPVLALLVFLATLLPSLSVAVRRLHDTGRSGWWLLIGLVPLVGGIVLLVFCVQDSSPQPNAYGPSPKQAGYAGGPAPAY